MMYLQQFSFDHWQTLCLFASPRFGYSGETIEPLSIESERQRVQTIADASTKVPPFEKAI